MRAVVAAILYNGVFQKNKLYKNYAFPPNCKMASIEDGGQAGSMLSAGQNKRVIFAKLSRTKVI